MLVVGKDAGAKAAIIRCFLFQVQKEIPKGPRGGVPVRFLQKSGIFGAELSREMLYLRTIAQVSKRNYVLRIERDVSLSFTLVEYILCVEYDAQIVVMTALCE